MKKTILLLSLLICAAMVFTACAPPAAVEDAPAAEEAASDDGGEEMAEGDGEEMAEGDGECVVVIGAAISETGKYAREGKDVRQGYDLWAEWVNGEGGGITIGDATCSAEIIYYDDESDPDTVSRLVEKLVTEDEVDLLLGPYSSSMTMAASAIAEKYDMIMVEGNGSSESLFERGFKNLFAVLTPAGNYGESALKALSELGAESVVIAYEDTAFPTSVATGAIAWAEEYGMEVLGVETYPKDVADVSGIMAKFKEMEPDVFLGGGHFNDALLFVRAAKELDFNPKAMVRRGRGRGGRLQKSSKGRAGCSET
ncbi:MAG: amino acid ABC transporter substrate-binding protein [Chloroflexota bacterium]